MNRILEGIQKTQLLTETRTYQASPAQQPAAPGQASAPASASAARPASAPGSASAPDAALAGASTPNAQGSVQTPSTYMYETVKQMLRGYDFEKRPEVVNTIKSAISKWEEAFKAQVTSSKGQWNGKFNGPTQKAFNTLISVVANQASASMSAGRMKNAPAAATKVAPSA